MSFFIYVAFVINAKSQYLVHFAYFVIAHCRTFVLPASRFLVCVHFRSSYQCVDFSDTLKLRAHFLFIYFVYYFNCVHCILAIVMGAYPFGIFFCKDSPSYHYRYIGCFLGKQSYSFLHCRNGCSHKST